jgi:hypothetical protein
MDLEWSNKSKAKTLHQYMRRFFDKHTTVVDVTDKKVINLF